MMNIDGSLLMGVAALITSFVNVWRALRPVGGGDSGGAPHKPAEQVRRGRIGVAMLHHKSALLQWRKRSFGKHRHSKGLGPLGR
ncbi:hypothetical protein [Sphingobium lactosutens]|uniref:hypothetical protein n=1 Tax=Sphingobium lactosutens TaxID=522773 RepID=UPI0015BB2CF8|nr:hypothetical protein [Sphingobium lactosutens]